MIGGSLSLAVGVGLSLFLIQTASKDGVWTVGLIPGLVGAVMMLLAKRFDPQS